MSHAESSQRAVIRFHVLWPQIPDAALGRRAANALRSPRAPSLKVDGRPVLINVGAQDIVVTAGAHHLEGSLTTTDGPVGIASMDVTVQNGQTVDVFYTAPAFGFRSGAMALAPEAPGLQPRENFYRTANFGNSLTPIVAVAMFAIGIFVGLLIAS